MDSFLTPYGLSSSSQEKLQFTSFGVGPKPGCSDSLHTGIIESHKVLLFSPILVKFHIHTRLIKSFPMIFRTSWWGEKNCTSHKFTPYATRSLTKP